MKKKANSFSPRSNWMKLGVTLCFFTLGILNMYAQQSKIITGRIVDENKEVLTGVSVVIKGTTTGTMTDYDGNYSLSAKVGDVIVASFVGMKSEEFTVGNSNKVDLTLNEDRILLGGNDGVVVVGYGSSKTKDLTSPIPTIGGDELSKHLTASPMSGMQGKVAGVQVQNSGAPGSAPTVRIRGVGNYDNAKTGPLYVVDGMLFDDISFLSSGDIESTSILKDASSAAIYGVRAANGVVIVTTKKGLTNTIPTITYDGNFGFQKASNVVKMASSAQYTKIMNDAISQDLSDANLVGYLVPINNSISRFGGTDGIPNTNNDWYKSMLRTAPIQSHGVNISGGGERTTYAMGVNYLNQDGIANFDNGYTRVNVRSKFDVKVTNWFKTGANIVISNSNQRTINLDAFNQAFRTPNIMPIYDENNTEATPEKFASTADLGMGQDYWNPYAMAYYSKNSTKRMQVLPSFFTQFSFLNDKLSIRSSYSQDFSFVRTRNYTPSYVVGGNQRNPQSYLKKTDDYFNNWIVDNTATYRDAIGNHSFTAMLGNSIRNERWEQLYGEAKNIPEGNVEGQYISQGDGESKLANDNGSEFRGLSYFGRFMYNYSDKYLASLTMRADGSSKYQEKWGYFPSAGLAWVISKEAFMTDQKVLDNLKIRANWGRLGNDKVAANDGFRTLNPVNNGAGTVFNNMGGSGAILAPGYDLLSFYSTLGWEVVEETDLGLDFAVLNSRLSGSLDYYSRETKNAVFAKPIPLSGGTLAVNNGSIKNSGIEVTLDWADQIGKDFMYNIGFNMSTLKNEVTNLDGLDRIVISGDQPHIRQLGVPVDSYYGYKVLGVYQNWDQVNNDPMAVANNLRPGDFIFKHAEGATSLSPNDREILGSAIPTLYLGGNIGMNYKNWDFSLSYQAQLGAKIINLKRQLRSKYAAENFDKNLADHLWTGENSTNSYPSAAALVGANNVWNINNFNSFFIEKSDNFSIQNVQVGYTFKNCLHKYTNKGSLRLSLNAERPLNIFSYNGFTTDIPNGLDNSTYPLASTYSFGIKLIY